MITLSELRQKFLSFFEKNSHTVVKSSSLVPNDPTLLFTNAGMVQFKNYFTGEEKAPYKRAVSCQKCVRAGGKHNDLDNVGYTARHHTFFEMLGNFSFGDYFKEDAIKFAWTFLTKELAIPREKLLVTVYHTDEEAINIWKKVANLPDEKIIKITTKDNFWSMGDTGPCGPCSEIFYDHGEDIWGGVPGSPEEDGDRYIEIWNLVFMQFEQKADGTMVPLPKPSIDTGIGLERLTAVLQGVHNNYDIDLFVKLIENSQNIIGMGDVFSHRIIADHLRSSAFLICDGVLPSNEGRGYVLRRIMRRAMRHIHKLGAKEPMMFRLVPRLVDLMGDHYKELKEYENLIMETLQNEEVRFRQTLDRGINILSTELASLENKKMLDGKVAFTLYDTYGFPLDLTQSILREKGIEVDIDEFNREMDEQKKRAKEAWAGSGDVKNNEIYFKIKEKIAETEFVGYDKNTERGRILALIKNGVEVSEVKKGDEFEFFIDKTPFYGECGGQVGDTGIAIQVNENGVVPLPFSIVEITDTLRPFGHLFLHMAKLESGSLKVGDYLNLSINKERRNKIRANHSGVHLLLFALRTMFGDTVLQKGSYVDDKRLRFDFSFSRQIKKEELQNIEKIINEVIFYNSPVSTKLMELEKAREYGAMALFNEKYEDTVRVVEMGELFAKVEGKRKQDCNTVENVAEGLNDLNNSSLKKSCSVELCGGTHVGKTGEVGIFKIIKEESIASGIRRIEAVTGLEALNYLNHFQYMIDDIADEIQSSPSDVVERVKQISTENKECKKIVETLKKAQLANIGFEEDTGKYTFAFSMIKNENPKDVKNMLVELQNRKYNKNAVAICFVLFEGKLTIMISVSKDISDKVNAVDLVRKAVEMVGGNGGGGQAWFAMGGAPFDENSKVKIEDIIRELKNTIEK